MGCDGMGWDGMGWDGRFRALISNSTPEEINRCLPKIYFIEGGLVTY